MNQSGQLTQQGRWRAARAPAPWSASVALRETEEEGATAENIAPELRRLSIWAGAGALLMVLAWLLPVHWKSLAPAVVNHAGRGTTTLGDLGLAQIAQDKPGPARLVLATAQLLKTPHAEPLASALADLAARRPELVPWGGADPLLDSVFKPSPIAAKPVSEPVLQLFLTESARGRLRQHLADDRSRDTRAILQTRELTNTAHFVPALQPGGQPYEATILLMGLIHRDDRIPLSLAHEIRTVANQANESRTAEAWENACLNLLTLGARLDWVQLIELLHHVPNLQTLAQLARLAKTAPDQFPTVYSACLFTLTPERVTKYLTRFGQAGLDSLAGAVAAGDGAVQLLLRRQLPISPKVGGEMAFLSPLVLKAPELSLGLKISGFVLAILCFYVVWSELSTVESAEGLSALSRALRWRRSGIAVVLALLLAAASEPFLLPNLGAPQFNLRLQQMPVLSNSSVPKSENPQPKNRLMHLDTSTILSVALFAALQVVVYAACLLRIREIGAQSCSPQLKLKLMDNEENLFDSGLYVGIAGTAAALVLQVLGLIEANLLAAYSSNLFGILCVALVKIRHVRAFKRTLIMQPPTAATTAQPLAPSLA